MRTQDKPTGVVHVRQWWVRGTNIYTGRYSHCITSMETLNRLCNILDNSSAMHIKRVCRRLGLWLLFLYNIHPDILKSNISEAGLQSDQKNKRSPRATGAVCELILFSTILKDQLVRTSSSLTSLTSDSGGLTISGGERGARDWTPRNNRKNLKHNFSVCSNRGFSSICEEKKALKLRPLTISSLMSWHWSVSWHCLC